jgi:hypothetical protein
MRYVPCGKLQEGNLSVISLIQLIFEDKLHGTATLPLLNMLIHVLWYFFSVKNINLILRHLCIVKYTAWAQAVLPRVLKDICTKPKC